MLRKYILVVLLACSLLLLIVTNKTSQVRSYVVETAAAYKIQYENDVLCIYLTDTIMSSSEYLGLIMFINRHQHVENIRLYLAGNGGSVAAAESIILAMHNAPTVFTAYLIGDVYSSHAAIALNADRIISVDANIIFLFHQPAFLVGGEYVTYKEYCAQIQGYDRGVSKALKCLAFQATRSTSFDEIAMNNVFKYLTTQELMDYNNGNDVILTAAQIGSRLHAISQKK